MVVGLWVDDKTANVRNMSKAMMVRCTLVQSSLGWEKVGTRSGG